MTDNTNTAQRLQEAAAKCLSSLDTWNKDLKDDTAREGLLEAVHELRKVTSRLEIDIAMNDRKAMNAKPIPIPEHKSKMDKKKNQKPLSEILPVAELREKGEKRKIAIQEAKEAETDAEDNTVDDTVESQAEDENKKKQRRPRRQKRESSKEEE